MGALRSRPFVILITVCILLCSVFVVSASAASDNLIESDLTQWTNIDGSFTVSAYRNGDLFRLSSNTSSTDYFLGIVYDLPSFIAGHSYTLKFRLPSGSDISSVWGINYTDDNLLSHYKNSTVLVGYGYLDPSGTKLEIQNDLFEFNSSNVSKYIGSTLTTSFVAGSSSGRPVVFILLSNTDGNVHHFFFSDFVMFDNDDNSGELKGIKGFLHSIRWDIIGGICDDSDCPHSSDVNPHRSLTERMTIGFQNLFESIASKFEDGSTLNTWFNNLSSGVTKLGSNIDGFLKTLGDRFNGFISGLGSSISDNFNTLGIDLGGWFGDTVDSIDSFFDGLWKKFNDFFDKFKPRVYERFKWHRGIINWNTGEVTLKDDDYPYVIVSDFLTVAPGSVYILNYEHTAELSGLAVFQYDYYGNYIGVFATYTSSVSDVVLPSGFLYRFRCQFPIGDTHLNNINSYVRVYCDEGWINSILHQIEDFGNGIVNLILYFDWYGYYENPFNNILPVLTVLAEFTESISDFIIDFNDSFLDFINSASGGISLFGYVVENVPYLFPIAIISLGLVVISRVLGL